MSRRIEKVPPRATARTLTPETLVTLASSSREELCETYVWCERSLADEKLPAVTLEIAAAMMRACDHLFATTHNTDAEI